MEEKSEIVRLKDDFYRDGFYKVLFALITICSAIGLLAVLSFYLYQEQPPPVFFATDNEWRILPDVPVNQPYLNTPDLVQWVSTVIPAAFHFDFVNYTTQMNNLQRYFTPEGWKKYNDQIAPFVNQTVLQNGKLFVNGSAFGAPFILNQGMLQGRYGWWIQMPIAVEYATFERSTTQNISVQVLVVRIPTLNNLDGVAIDNFIILAKNTGTKTQP